MMARPSLKIVTSYFSTVQRIRNGFKLTLPTFASRVLTSLKSILCPFGNEICTELRPHNVVVCDAPSAVRNSNLLCTQHGQSAASRRPLIFRRWERGGEEGRGGGERRERGGVGGA